MTTEQALDLALQHHQAGRLAEAEALYRQILAVQPNHADALHLLGVIAHQVGGNDMAVELIQRAIACAPASAPYYSNLGIALVELDRFEEAVAAYRRAIELQPRAAEAHNNLGIALRYQGRFEESAAACRQALLLKRDFADAHYNLGNALRDQRELDEAIGEYRSAIEINPGHVEACNNLGNALKERGRLAEATVAYRRALELDPVAAGTYNNLGGALQEQGRMGEAIAMFRRAMELDPDLAVVHNNLGVALVATGQVDDGIAAIRQALALQPHYAHAWSNLGTALKDRAQLDEAMACYQRVMALQPDMAVVHSMLVYNALFHPAYDARELREETARWQQAHSAPLAPFIQPHTNIPQPDRRLKIGYVSPNFRRHVICHFLVPLLEAHDHANFEVFCYAIIRHPDTVTARMKKCADAWRDVPGLTDETLAGMIRADGIDILVDLTQHMAENRLAVFARKPAPIQVTWLGYPGSTGVPTIDYRLTDAAMEPFGAPWSESVETPVRLPDSWFCFDPIEKYPEPDELPALRASHVTFGCLNNFCKINDAVLQLWANVLSAVPNSHLLLQCPQGVAQARVRSFFEARGIEIGRLELAAHLADRAAFLALFQRIDIALDPFPYNGGTTTCEALWMGIPVLTLPGELIVSRIGLSILSAAGLGEFAAESESDYLRLAASLAGDLPRLAHLRTTLRARMKASPFMDGPRFARHVEHAYREMWRTWCARQQDRP